MPSVLLAYTQKAASLDPLTWYDGGWGILSMALQEGAMLGPYRIRHLLGEGGMGAVYEAIHTEIDRTVAIKVLHPKFATSPDAVRRFFNEARAVNRVEHPSVVQISEAHHLDDGTAYLVMELLRGESLAARLKRHGGRLQAPEVIRIARQLASALAATHAKGIVHRDLKPDNVMLVPDAEVTGRLRVRILDFGVAKLLEQGSPGQNQQIQTRPDAIIGTPCYMSPEQCRGTSGIDEKTDVYALGVIIFEALAERPPFVEANHAAVMAMHVFEVPPPLGELAPEAPKELVALVMRMLSKKKDERPTMAQIVTVLSEPSLTGDNSSSAISLGGVTIPASLLANNTPGPSSQGSDADPNRGTPLLAGPQPRTSGPGQPEKADPRPTVTYPGGESASASSAKRLRPTASGAVSTLGESVGQRRQIPMKSRRSQVLLALAGGLGLLLCGAGYLSLRHGAVQHPAAPAPATAPPPAAAAPAPPKDPAPLPSKPEAVVPPADPSPLPQSPAELKAAAKRAKAEERAAKKKLRKHTPAQ